MSMLKDPSSKYRAYPGPHLAIEDHYRRADLVQLRPS